MKNVDFYFDFASPNAYLVHQVLPGLAERTGAAISYVPCLLGGIFKATNNKAPMIQYAGIKNKSEYEMLEFRRFITRHGLDKFKMNPHFPVNTLLLMRGAIVAQEQNALARYIDAMMPPMWELGRKMDDPSEVVAALDAAGFDGAALLARTQDDAVKGRLAANTEAAVVRGVFGIPTFFVGDEMFFGKERLAQVEELLNS